MYKLIISFLLFVSTIYASSINIAVAANVSYAIDELIKKFNKTNPNIKVRVNLASSGKLTAQIKNNAPFDIFMSANMKYPNNLYKSGFATTKPVIYAKGALALLSSKKREFTNNLAFLKEDEITKIAVANPKTAPYGVATIEALKTAKLYESLKQKFVYGESISQTVTYTLLATDIGFIAKSSLYSSKMERFKKDENWVDINPDLYTPINQGVVVLKNAKDGAELFYDFILSKEAKKIFKKYGYLLP